MVAIQISVNGQPLYTAGIGEFGLLSSHLEWGRILTNSGHVHEHLWIGARGMDGSAKSQHHWQNIGLKVGDEVTLKVVDVPAADPPLAGMPDFPTLS